MPSKKYSSSRARVPSHWGKATWDALFLLAADYPHEFECGDDHEYSAEMIQVRKNAWRQLLKALPGVLTCNKCADHFGKYLQMNGGRDLEWALEDRERLLRWLYRCKDEINHRNQRQSPALENVRRKYVPRCSKRRRR